MGIELREANGVASFWFGHLIFFKFMNDSQKKFKWNKKFQKKETQIYRRRYIEFQFE